MAFHNMRRYGVVVLITAAAVALLLPATSANRSEATSTSSHCRFKALFNFGDSNSDTGALSALLGEFSSPNGETYFHHPVGRASDGRLIIDFIAESLGLPFLSGYLDSIGADYSHGVNFATGGSTILSPNITMSQGGASPISLSVQYRQYSQFKTRSQVVRNKGGRFEHLLPDEDSFSRGLYTFDIGMNDLLAAFKLNLSADQVKRSVPDLLLHLSTEIKNVYAKGARTFWIHNAGPTGCLPYTLLWFPVTRAEIDKHGCSKPHNEVSQFFNVRLKETIDQLGTVLPLASFTYVDIYSAKYTLISNAKKLGFDDPLLVCCGHSYHKLFRCGEKEYVNGTFIVDSCANPESRIIWDGLHYTEAANQWVFDKIVDGSFSDPPVPLSLACHHYRH